MNLITIVVWILCKQQFNCQNDLCVFKQVEAVEPTKLFSVG
jgi:hypothetical protein